MDLREKIKVEELEKLVAIPWYKDITNKVNLWNYGDFDISSFKAKNETIITWGISLSFNEALEEDDNLIDEVSSSLDIQLSNDKLVLSIDVLLGAKILYCVDENYFQDFQKINSSLLDQFLIKNENEVLKNIKKGINIMRSGSIKEGSI